MQFAVAKKRITPQKPVFLAGFAGRTHKSGEALDELYVKTVLLSANRNLLIVVFDALGADRGFVLGVKAALRERFGLEEADVLLQFTHTHASVYLTGELPEHRRGNYSIGQERWHDDSATIDYAEDEAFYREVKGIVLELTERCMATLEPGCVKLGVGRSR
ncbi:MAG: hypothetical protein K0Q59_5572, partial [Paenibacillus sp.]|nr:hypothetical protein [Paenibacillus sp.]